MTSRSQARKAGVYSPVKVPITSKSSVVDRGKLKWLQHEDNSLKKVEGP